MILVSKFMVPKGFTGITLFPFVFVKYAQLKENKVFVNHERIHLKQQIELLIIPFFIWYALEFLVRYAHYRNWYLAYRNISFEREAYHEEENLEFLKIRPFWNFLKYLYTP
ncbi:hypothetical protein ES711_13115 [Gelidibacter salicanalis]|uniref:DUF4157 domain-containing protein n=1 Tax=Gelidibacter salicanalis TaxID=291193 RepID=A0A5C7AM60_9FLAO|nr:hypothetical protein [Gelidibacter salicanalis]TXE06882.1 hypothetical protein ES711_13115 [Gelidibacter salicanalis]